MQLRISVNLSYFGDGPRITSPLFLPSTAAGLLVRNAGFFKVTLRSRGSVAGRAEMGGAWVLELLGDDLGACIILYGALLTYGTNYGV